VTGFPEFSNSPLRLPDIPGPHREPNAHRCLSLLPPSARRRHTCLPPRASPCARLPHSDHTRITASSIGIELISKQIRTRLEASTPPRLDHMRRTSDFRTRRHRRLMWRHREEAPHRKPVNPASLQVTLISFSHIRFLLECHPGPIAICAHKYFFSRTLMMLLCSCPPRTTGGHGQERPNCS
jgi:hypothetical protein